MSLNIFTLEQLESNGIVQLGRGKIISKMDLDNNKGIYPVYSSSKMGDGKFGEYGEFMFDEELITWSVDGGGKLFYREKHKFSITNVTGFLRIKNREIVDYKYLFYCLSLLHSNIKFDWVKKAHPSVLRKEYKYIPLPSLTTQQKIVSKLDAIFVEIDKATAAVEANARNAEVLFQSYLNEVFNREHPNQLKSTLGEYYDVRDGTHDSPKFYDEGYPLITSKNLKCGDINFDKVQYISKEDYLSISQRSAVKKGDVLMAMIGTIGNPVVIESEEEFAIKNVALFKTSVAQSPYYLRYYLSSSNVVLKMLKDAKGATQKFVGLGYLRSFPITIPPLEAQIKIVKELEGYEQVTTSLVKSYKLKALHFQNLKQSTLKQAFNGELIKE